MRAILLLGLALSPNLRAQDTLRAPAFHEKRELGIMIGYSKEIGAADKRPIHFLDLGIARGAWGGRHMDSRSIYVSSLFGLSGNTPILAPRVGVQAAMLFSLGAELAWFTDLHQGSLVLLPRFGYLGYPLNISLAPHVYLTNTTFRPAGGGCLSITMRIATLKRYTPE